MRTKTLNAFHAVLCLVVAPVGLRAETVSVKYGNEIDLAPFQCTDISQSGPISRVCYDGAKRYLLIRLEQTYHQHCEIEAGTVERFVASVSIDHFFRAIIENKYNCRPETVPKYEQAGQPPPAIVTSSGRELSQ